MGAGSELAILTYSLMFRLCGILSNGVPVANYGRGCVMIWEISCLQSDCCKASQEWIVGVAIAIYWDAWSAIRVQDRLISKLTIDNGRV